MVGCCNHSAPSGVKNVSVACEGPRRMVGTRDAVELFARGTPAGDRHAGCQRMTEKKSVCCTEERRWKDHQLRCKMQPTRIYDSRTTK